MRVESVTEKDLDECRQLIVQSIRVLASPCYTAAQIDAWLGQYPDARVMATWTRRSMMLMRDEVRIVGFGQLELAREEIVGVHVAPERSRAGIGARLVQSLERIAVNTRISVLQVQASLNAVDFYAACGYESGDEITFRCSNGVRMDARHMRKSLITMD